MDAKAFSDEEEKNTSYAQLAGARCCLLVFARISSGGARRPCFPTATNGQVRAMVLAPGKRGRGGLDPRKQGVEWYSASS